MARPRKPGLDYFPFDVGFFEEENIACIAGEFGIKGEITAVKLLCAVYRNGYFLEWNDMVRFKLLRDLPGVSAELLDQIVNRLVRWGFFDSSLFGSVKVLTSQRIQLRYFEATKYRMKDEKLMHLLIPFPKDYSDKKSLKGVSQQETPISQQETLVSHGKTPQIKRNIKKEEDKSSSQKSGVVDELRCCVEEYKSKEIWLSDMEKKFKLPRQDIIASLDEFYLDTRCKQYNVRNVPYIFNLWLTDKLERIKNEQVSKGRGCYPKNTPRKGKEDPGYGLVD